MPILSQCFQCQLTAIANQLTGFFMDSNNTKKEHVNHMPKNFPEDDDELFFRNGWMEKSLKLCFQLEIFLNALAIPNLEHAMNRIWNCVERKYRLCWIKICNSDNHYTIVSWLSKIRILPVITILGYYWADSLTQPKYHYIPTNSTWRSPGASQQGCVRKPSQGPSGVWTRKYWLTWTTLCILNSLPFWKFIHFHWYLVCHLGLFGAPIFDIYLGCLYIYKLHIMWDNHMF